MKNYFQRFIEKHSQTIGERTEVDEMMALTFILQSAFCHNVVDPKWTWKKYYIYHLMNLALVIYVFFGTMEIIKSATDFQIVAEAYYTVILIYICPPKLLLFISNRFAFRKLYLTTKTTFFNLVKNDFEEKLIEVLKTGTKVVFTMFLMVTIPVLLYEIIGIWNYFKGTRILLSRSTSTLLPMTSPYYEISYFLHTLFLTEMSTIMVINDICFVFLVFFLCIASDSLVKLLIVEPRRADETEISYAKRLNEALNKFYVAHLDQVEYLNTLNEMYKWLALAPLCNTALCVCLALVVMSKEANWHFASLFLPLFAEIFAYSWFGEQIKTKIFSRRVNETGVLYESKCSRNYTTEILLEELRSSGLTLYLILTNDIRTALLNFDWTNLQLKDKKSYYIIVMYMGKEFGVKTAIGHELCLITMSSVLKFSYQAFTVLQTVE